MTGAVRFVQIATDVAFLVLALVSLRAWVRHRDPSQGWLALAIGSIAYLAGFSLAGVLGIATLGRAGTASAMVIFLLGGYALLRFRGTFIPLGRASHGAALSAVAVGIVVGVASNVPSLAAAVPGLVAVGPVVLVGVWGGCVAEPIVRFLRASRNRPAVQRARLRALALGYGTILAILVFSVVGAGLARRPEVQLATSMVAFLTVPILYVSFSAPIWLRRIWREAEADAFRRAIRALLLFSPSRDALAQRAAEWATRLVGAEGAYIADSDGRIMAVCGLSMAEAEVMSAVVGRGEERIQRLGERRDEVAFAVPLNLGTGAGTLAVVSGAFTPFFGIDEIAVVREYATNVTLGLDRAVLTERIAALERTKTEFLNMASHELRGPITIIRGYLSMLESGTLGVIPDGLAPVLPVLVQRAEEMSLLIDQMIEAARLEEGRLELATRRVDLRELAHRAVDLIRPLAGTSHPLVLDQSPVEVAAVVDPERTATILGNLISNAIKYSPQGGEVRVAVCADAGVARVEVIDQGIGIEKAQMARLFTRFGRIVTPATSQIAGTGLGLYLSRELARLHGGDLVAESVPGRGSKFTLMVPAADA